MNSHKKTFFYTKRAVLPVTLFLIFFMLITLPTNASAEFEEETGGVAFGTPVGKIKGLINIGERGGIKLYARSRDKLEYQGIKLEKRLYGFKDGMLAAVELWTYKKGPALKYECTDLPAAATNKIHKNLKERFGRHKSRRDTNLHGHYMRREVADCNALDAYNCIVTRHSAEPPENNPDARRFTATLTTYQWIRQRDINTLTPNELRKVKRRDPTVSLDEYTCQHRIRFTEGISRKQIDGGAKRRNKLLDLLK